MKKGIFFGILVIIAVLATFAGGSAYYIGSLQRGNAFLEGTVINGQNVSGQTPAQVTAGYAADVASGEVVLLEDGKEVFHATLSDLGYALDEEAFEASLTDFLKTEKADTETIFQSLLNGNSFSLDLPYTFAEDTFKAAVSKNALTVARKENTNAKIVYSNDAGKCIIQPEVQGTKLHDRDLRAWLKDEIVVVFDTAKEESTGAEGETADKKAAGESDPGQKSSDKNAAEDQNDAAEQGNVSAETGGASAEEGGAEAQAAAAASAKEQEKSDKDASAEEKEKSDKDVTAEEKGNSDKNSSEEEKEKSDKDATAGEQEKSDRDVSAEEQEKSDKDTDAADGDKTEGYSIVRTIPASLYIVPDVTAKNERLLQKCDMLNKYADETITYVFGSTRETLEFKTFMNWIKIQGDEVSVRDEKVAEYVSGIAEKYNTRYRERVFTTTWGSQVTFPAGLNEYGYTILETQEAAQLAQDILSGQSVEREPIYLSYNDWGDPCYLSRNGMDDLNGTYVEVSIGAQHMWYYLNGALFLESDVVTGDITLDQGTASGVFPLAFKESPSTLKGGEGKKKYTTKVQYWMPFYEGQGLHDAWWKTVFGGDEYKGNGSHGCVNLPSSVAESLYNNIVPGTAIIIYN